MIKHIVVFRLKDFAQGATKAENAIKIKNMLDELPALINVIRKFETGIDVLRSDRSFDLGLIAEFDNLDDLNTYAVHPEHLRVVDFIKSVREESKSVDYEF